MAGAGSGLSSQHPHRQMAAKSGWRSGAADTSEMGGFHGPAADRRRFRFPLRDNLVEARHGLGGRTVSGSGGAGDAQRNGHPRHVLRLRWLLHQSPSRRSSQTRRTAGPHGRRAAAPARTWRPRPDDYAPVVRLERLQMD